MNVIIALCSTATGSGDWDRQDRRKHFHVANRSALINAAISLVDFEKMVTIGPGGTGFNMNMCEVRAQECVTVFLGLEK